MQYTIHDLARRWGITLAAVRRRRERLVGFPEPVARGPHGVALYRAEDVAAFESEYAATRRRSLIKGAA